MSKTDTLKVKVALLQFQVAQMFNNMNSERCAWLCMFCVSVCLWVCGTLFLEHDSLGSTMGVCSWKSVKQTGHLPLPNVGANSDIHVREVLLHASSHLLVRLCQQNGDAERHDKARATAVSWPTDTCPRGVWHKPGHLCFDESSSPGLSTLGAAHALKC